MSTSFFRTSGFISALTNLLLWGLVAAFILTALARYHFMAELASHFQLQYLLAAVLLMLLQFLRREKAWIGGILVVACGLQVGSLLLPREVKTSDEYEDIRVLQFNVKKDNPYARQMAEWILELEPDLVVLQEVTPEIAAGLAALDNAYPYQLREPREGAFGSVIYSAIPFTNKQRTKFQHPWNEYSEIGLRTPKLKLPVALTEVHAYPPASPKASAQRNTELSVIAEVISRQPEQHRILIGDLNITPYSPYFHDLVQDTGMQNAMQGKTLSGTWPAIMPPPLRIPIDHLLVSDRIGVVKRQLAPELHSDHLPVLTTLRLYTSK